jgi:hypothetical protein
MPADGGRGRVEQGAGRGGAGQGNLSNCNYSDVDRWA